MINILKLKNKEEDIKIQNNGKYLFVLLIPLFMLINILLFSTMILNLYCFLYHQNLKNITNSIYINFAYIGSFLGDLTTVLILLGIFLLKPHNLEEFKNTFKLNIKKIYLLKILFFTLILYLVFYFIHFFFIRENSTSVKIPIYEIIIVVFFIPFLEEIIFRFFLLNYLNKILNIYLTIFVQALLFGVVHVALNRSEFFQGCYTFALGILLGFVYSKNKNLNESYCCHMFFNAITLIIIPMLYKL